MDTTPYWITSHGSDAPAFPPLDRDLEVDVLVIGGGITGVSCAELLSQSKLKVALVEARELGAGDTSHTTAHLTYMTDTRLSDLLRVCGREEAKLAWQAGHAAMEHIRATAARCGAGPVREIPGYLAAARGGDMDKERDTLRKEQELRQEFGFQAEWAEEISPTGAPGIRFAGQMKFHPLDYIHALAKAAAGRGVRIFERTNVDEFHDSPSHVIANGHKISYERVIIATHVPLQGNSGTTGAALFQTKLASYSTYAVSADYPAGSLPEIIWSDTADPFNYLRIDRGDGRDVVIFGGEDHKTGQVVDTAECYHRLERRLESYLGKGTVTHRWSGQVVETVDGLPYIGETTAGQFIATGFSGNGMTFGPAAALMAQDWINGVENPCRKVFSPSRVHLAALVSYAGENKDFPYRMLKDRFVPSGEPADLSAGEGRVVRCDGKLLAICRDSHGKASRLSAICPHMGCVVAWNPVEETWDCPCHGSRFASDGALIAGPAESDLKPAGA